MKFANLQLVAAIVTAACAGAGVAAGQSFVNVTAAAGINHVSHWQQTLPPPFQPAAIQEQSGAAAAGDFDGDGWPDLYVSRFWDSDLLYRNNRDGTFTDVTATAFAGGIGAHATNGAAWGDVDNDGDLDLAVATMNESRHLLYLNDGAGGFTEQGASRGLLIANGLPTTSGSGVGWGDYDRDGYLDVFIAEWRGFNTTNKSNPSHSRLFRNLGAANPGHFQDVTAAAGVALDLASGVQKDKALAFTPRFADFDRDGHTDFAITSDGGTSRLFWNNGDGTFVDGTVAAGIATGTNDMGFTLADFNGDGLLDWFATSIASFAEGDSLDPPQSHPFGNRLFLNDGDRTFTDATDAAGVRMGGWGWGADVIDYDNNSLLDLIHVNGFGFSTAQHSVLFKNTGTRTVPQFDNVAPAVGVTDLAYGRGLLTFDYDRDGDQDVFIVNYGNAPILYRNDGGSAAGRWLQVEAVGTESNRDGVGALVTVTPDLDQPQSFQFDQVDGSTNYLGQSELAIHFGLAAAASVDRIEIEWPTGAIERYFNVPTNQRVTITESLRADFDASGGVAAPDLGRWLAGVGLATGAARTDGDATGDGAVDGADLLLWQRTLGRSGVGGLAGTTTAAGGVPEPGGGALVLLGGTVRSLGRGRRRRD